MIVILAVEKVQGRTRLTGITCRLYSSDCLPRPFVLSIRLTSSNGADLTAVGMLSKRTGQVGIVRDDDRSIAEVARAAGFASPSHFRQAAKQCCNLTRRWRQKGFEPLFRRRGCLAALVA
jgi:AraC-like DNA-binding protein